MLNEEADRSRLSEMTPEERSKYNSLSSIDGVWVESRHHIEAELHAIRFAIKPMPEELKSCIERIFCDSRHGVYAMYLRANKMPKKGYKEFAERIGYSFRCFRVQLGGFAPPISVFIGGRTPIVDIPCDHDPDFEAA
ncbi:MAG: hypothetical protein WDN46_24190 [Methylocella sp.]